MSADAPHRHRTAVTVAAVAAAGVALTAATAAAAHLPALDATELAGYAVAGAGAASLIVAVALLLLARRSVAVQAAVASLSSVWAIGAGVALAANAMFISSHDLRAILVVVVASSCVGVCASLILGRRVATAGASLRQAARGLAGPASAEAVGAPGGPAELVALGRELERTRTALGEARSRSDALERSRRELVAWVSHDLRTPLAGIRAIAEALEDGLVDEPTTRRYHRLLGEETDRLAGLIDDLFELSRIHAGAMELTLRRVPLDELVSAAVERAAVTARSKGVRLEEAVERGTLVDLAAGEMTRVVGNLLDNAIRHTPAGGLVRVEAGLDASRTEARVCVLDSCGGIPADELDRVFDLAFRGDRARTPGDGAGLGLAIAQGFVEAHRGRITVDNTPPGCRFTVRLPVVAAGQPTRP